MGAEAAWLPGGRLHLNHGPIDLVIGVEGPGAAAALAAAQARFATVLDELVAELPVLRARVGPPVQGAVAARMRAACLPQRAFITPMAAVAGAVADEILAAMTAHDLTRAYVNNGGDVAVHLGAGQTYVCEIAGTTARAMLERSGGIATSGAGGRSLSLGIADSVTVIARTAAVADACATLIANAVDLPGHPAITRRPACDIRDDSDLGDLPVTVGVGVLSADAIAAALANGLGVAEDMRRDGMIDAALLHLRGQTRTTTGAAALIHRREHA